MSQHDDVALEADPRGDLVHAVNGRSLTSLEEAMEAYRSLQEADGFTVELTRRGRRRVQTYAVR